MNKKTDPVEQDFDFGFSFVDEDYQQVKDASSKLHIDYIDVLEKNKDLEHRLDALFQNIMPFLDNLCKNPEKTTIHWPNRAEKIQQFKKKLENIREGKI